ncbi:MAG: Rieske 2Fe-2S domain-containing protein [Betaproteobacteria bacterium]|nr:Rieske 2Fe-2S domain-containing protein [Betaproteobacteria bacterium]
MSDLASQRALTRTPTQLPLSWYFDPKVAEIENRVLFERGPGYVGHAMMAPQPGDYRVLDWREAGPGWALVNNGGRHDMVSNVCRHRQAVMLTGAGQLPGGTITCPVHRWAYDGEGRHIGAPQFPDHPCLDLPRQDLQHWQGMLFNGPRDIAADLASMGAAKDLDFEGYVLDKVDVVDYGFNWKTFIEVYLEDYHVAPYHPGLGHFVSCDDLKWEYGPCYSVQTVGVNNALAKPGSAVYAKWHEQVLKFRQGEPPPHGAIWLTYYPNIMVEWYPHVLVVSTLWPRGPEQCVNVVEFYYPEEIALFEREFVAAEQKAYDETAVEDKEICDRMTQGRRALWLEGREEQGPYQSPMEDGMVHFHEFIRGEIAKHL